MQSWERGGGGALYLFNVKCNEFTCFSSYLAHPPRPVLTLAPALIPTQDQTQIPLLPGPTPISHQDPRVHVQDLGLVHPRAIGDAEGAFRRQVVVLVVTEVWTDEDVAQAKHLPTTTGGDDSYHCSQVSITRCFLRRSSPVYFITVALPIPCSTCNTRLMNPLR